MKPGVDKGGLILYAVATNCILIIATTLGILFLNDSKLSRCKENVLAVITGRPGPSKLLCNNQYNLNL